MNLCTGCLTSTIAPPSLHHCSTIARLLRAHTPPPTAKIKASQLGVPLPTPKQTEQDPSLRATQVIAGEKNISTSRLLHQQCLGPSPISTPRTLFLYFLATIARGKKKQKKKMPATSQRPMVKPAPAPARPKIVVTTKTKNTNRPVVFTSALLRERMEALCRAGVAMVSAPAAAPSSTVAQRNPSGSASPSPAGLGDSLFVHLEVVGREKGGASPPSGERQVTPRIPLAQVVIKRPVDDDSAGSRLVLDFSGAHRGCVEEFMLVLPEKGTETTFQTVVTCGLPGERKKRVVGTFVVDHDLVRHAHGHVVMPSPSDTDKREGEDYIVYLEAFIRNSEGRAVPLEGAFCRDRRTEYIYRVGGVSLPSLATGLDAFIDDHLEPIKRAGSARDAARLNAEEAHKKCTEAHKAKLVATEAYAKAVDAFLTDCFPKE